MTPAAFRAWLAAHSLTIRQAAALLGVSPHTPWGYLHRRTAPIPEPVARLCALADAGCEQIMWTLADAAPEPRWNPGAPPAAKHYAAITQILPGSHWSFCRARADGTPAFGAPYVGDYRSRARAMVAAYAAGYTHAAGPGAYKPGISIHAQCPVARAYQAEHAASRARLDAGEKQDP